MRCHPGAILLDLIDIIEPTLRKKSDIVMTYCPRNDITNNANTFQNKSKNFRTKAFANRKRSKFSERIT